MAYNADMTRKARRMSNHYSMSEPQRDAAEKAQEVLYDAGYLLELHEPVGRARETYPTVKRRIEQAITLLAEAGIPPVQLPSKEVKNHES